MTPRQLFTRPFFIPLLILMSGILVYDRHHAPLTFPEDGLYSKKVWEGVVAGRPEKTKNGVRLPVQIEKAPLEVLLTIGESRYEKEPQKPEVSFKEGDVIRFTATLKKPTSYRNPGGFDYGLYLYRQGYGATGFTTWGNVEVIHSAPAEGWRDGMLSLRQHLTRFSTQRGYKEEGGILRALAWGERDGISEDTDDLFRDFGLSHLLVISGTHFGMLAFLVYFLCTRMLRFFPSLFLKCPGTKLAAYPTFLFLTAYYFFCEPSPSLTRGYLAAALSLAALLVNRSRDWLNLLFLAACGILIWEPMALFDLSFQFSFLAVASLILIYPKLTFLIPKGETRLKRSVAFVAPLFVAQAAITIGLLPLSLARFHVFPWSGIFMNLLAIPFIETLLVPLSLLSFGLSGFFPVLAKGLMSLDLYLVSQMLRFLSFLRDHLPPPILAYPPHDLELLLYYALLLLGLLHFSKVWKRVFIGITAIALLVVVSLPFLRAWSITAPRITQIDVGQGDSILVELPGPKRYLIDGGGSPSFDLGEKVILPFLLHRRIPALDAVVITHADTDHYLGLPSIIRKYPVKEVWWNGVEDESKTFQALLDDIRVRKIPLKAVHAGDVMAGEGWSWEILWPPSDLQGKWKDNDLSVVMRLHSSCSALFTGDLEEGAERALMGRIQDTGDLDVDILKVGHHGSKTSTSVEWLRAVTPKTAVIGAGFHNRYRHPHPSVLGRLGDFSAEVRRTDLEGAIKLDCRP